MNNQYIILFGPGGCGKSAIAKKIDELGLSYFHSGMIDDWTKRGVSHIDTLEEALKTAEEKAQGQVLLIDMGIFAGYPQSQTDFERLTELLKGIKDKFLILPSKNLEISEKTCLDRKLDQMFDAARGDIMAYGEVADKYLACNPRFFHDYQLGYKLLSPDYDGSLESVQSQTIFSAADCATEQDIKNVNPLLIITTAMQVIGRSGIDSTRKREITEKLTEKFNYEKKYQRYDGVNMNSAIPSGVLKITGGNPGQAGSSEVE